MKEKFKKLFDKIKEFWSKLSSGMRKLLIACISLIVIAAIIVTVILNSSSTDDYIVLFPDMEASESAEVYKYLTSQNVSTKINEKGEIMVPKDQWDTLVYKLAEKGYPQSAPSYGTYFDNLSMTMTDSEKQQLMIKDLQDRLQITINRIDGIKGSVVTISYPEKSSYAWKDDESKASASVALTLEKPDSFTSENVNAVKNLVAFATQQMKPEDVIVIDTTTGRELGSSASDDKTSYDIVSRENYERIIRERIEESVENILSKPYGKDNVVAACTVSVNYDKISEEMMKYLPEDNGQGVVDWRHIIYKGQGTTTQEASGVSGEENNTDTPSYPNEDDNIAITDPDYLEREITYSISHVLTQTEKAQGVIKDSTIAITIKTDAPLSNTEKAQIIDLVKNATAISDTTKITVFDWQKTELETEPTEATKTTSVKNYSSFLLLLILLGVIVLAAFIIFLITRNAKRKIKANNNRNQRAVDQLEAKLEETKRRSLAEMANESNKEQKETASEVRKFAQDNPDLTAAIVRSMIMDDENKNNNQEEDDF